MTKGLESVKRYYESKLKRYGPTARGVDWSRASEQKRRFELLLKEVGPTDSVNDLGCGYGAMLHHLGPDNDYVGYDISPKMIATARKLWPHEEFVVGGAGKMRMADWTIASGIFNTPCGANEWFWRDHVKRTIEKMHACSSKGFAFNFLSTYAQTKRSRLFYLDSLEMLRLWKFCKPTLHSNSDYEFTLIARA